LTNLNGQLTYGKHITQHCAGASSFDRVPCSRIGDCNELVITIAHIVPVGDVENQASGWYVVVNPIYPSRTGWPGESTKSLTKPATGEASDYWTILIAPPRTILRVVPFQVPIEIMGTIANVRECGINLLSLQAGVVRE